MSETEERKARIESLLEGEIPVKLPKGKLIVLVGSWIIFFAIGIGALIDILGPQAATIALLLSLLGPTITVLIVPIIIMAVLAGGVIVLTVWLMVRLLKNHGYGLLKFSILLTAILVWVFFGITIAVFGWSWVSILLLIICIAATILPILYFTIWKQRLEIAGAIVQLCGKVTYEEKELFLPGFLKVFFVGILSTFGGFIATDISAYTIPTVDPLWYNYIPLVLYLFVLFFYVYINTFFFNAIVTAISYIWYRKKDPKFKDGLTIAVYQLPDLAVFAVFSALIKLIRMLLQNLQARYQKNPGGAPIGRAPWTGDAFRLADGIIANIWYYVNYFTLPSIVIEDVPATTAIKRSVHRLFDNWVDVLIKEWGVGAVFAVLQFLIVFIFAMGGALFGFILSTIYLPDYLLVMVIIGVIIFMFLSALVSKPFLSLLNDIYLTFLFGVILDKESKFKYENNLPKDLNDKLKDFFEAHPAIKRCSNCFTRIPEGAHSCPNCGQAYP